MKEASTKDLSLLLLLSIIWGSAFFNIKIATYSYEPFTLALVRVIFASIPLFLLCKFKKIKIEAFGKSWNWYALIGLCNIAIPFVLIAIGTAKINSYLAAILMSTTPLSGSILAHLFTKNEKLSYLKSLGVLIGFSGIILLFFDKVIINSDNYVYALITILGSTFYCIGGLLTIKLKNRVNENVTTSTTLWSVIFLIPFSLMLEAPWNASPTLQSTLSLLYLGVIATGLAWLIRFRILTVNGLVFQTQVAYLIPIFGIFFGYFLMDEV
ncbi:DMT family transporter, partial [Pelagibacteraceae bacterium]|nr:DMT family transporter [Pelagibacteraceae bacterium]